MNRLWLALPVLLLCSRTGIPQLELAGSSTQASCNKYLKTPLPAEAAVVSKPTQWPNCTSYKSYSGIGTSVDFDAARKCAWSERLATQDGLEPRFTAASVFGGSAMLSQLYANGEGVEKNLPLALRFVCEAGGAPAEIRLRLEDLEGKLLKGDTTKTNFDFCDDITSGFMMGFCAAYGSEIAEQERNKELAKLTQDWTAAQKSAFQLLAEAEEGYAKAHAKGEVDLSGTARAMYQTDEQNGLRDNFLEALKLFEQGALPKASATEATDADKTLNREYRKAIADAKTNKSGYGAVQPEGIQDAERAWLKYRDAWIAFAKLRYTSVSESAWLKLLSDDRVLVLVGKCCGSGEDAVNKPRPLP
jgi:Lysozyme inhibitor LprI